MRLDPPSTNEMTAWILTNHESDVEMGIGRSGEQQAGPSFIVADPRDSGDEVSLS